MKKDKLQKEQEKNDIALFRYGIIAPIVRDIHDCPSKEEYYRKMSQKEYTLPNGTKTVLTPGTIKRWYIQYIANGMDGLIPKQRSDAGLSRTIPSSCIEKIEELKKTMPHITGKAIYRKIVEDGNIKLKDASLSSLYRFLNNNKLRTHNIVERKPFEMEFANDCWQGDTSHGPYITIDGKKVQTQLIQLIDDASRLIVGYKFFLNDTAINFQHVLKDAIATYGVPKRLFVDNGTPYKNKQLESICASLGIVLIHAKPYSPESKAKIERSFRTIKDNFLNCNDWNNYTSLEELNLAYRDYINQKYNNSPHSGIDNIPRNRFQRDFEKIKFIENRNELDKVFLHLEEKRVTLDGIVIIKGNEFEVPQKYIKQRILVKYNPEDLSYAYIYDPSTKALEEIRKVDKVANSKIKRNQISYS